MSEELKPMTFDRWHREMYSEWFHDSEAELRLAWQSLEQKGVLPGDIANVFDTVASAIRAEYGD